MKVTTHKNKEEFKPIKIELVIESKEELLNLWARSNFDQNTINKYTKSSLANYSDLRLFEALDNIKKSLNL